MTRSAIALRVGRSLTGFTISEKLVLALPASPSVNISVMVALPD